MRRGRTGTRFELPDSPTRGSRELVGGKLIAGYRQTLTTAIGQLRVAGGSMQSPHVDSFRSDGRYDRTYGRRGKSSFRGTALLARFW